MSPDETTVDTPIYEHQLESLMHPVTYTRTDIAYAVSVLSQFCSHSLPSYHQAVKSVFRHLSETHSHGLYIIVHLILYLLLLSLILLIVTVGILSAHSKVLVSY